MFRTRRAAVVTLFLAVALLSPCARLRADPPSSPVAAAKGALMKPERDYPVQPVPFTAVHFHDDFWAPRIETNRAVTIPYAFAKCEETGRVRNFEQAAAALRGEAIPDKQMPGFPFDDTDIYKVIEGASYALRVRPDPKLDAYVDGLIVKIAAAQEPDGYLYPARTIDPAHPQAWAGAHRWEQERVNSHELYNFGHLFEAAAAHYQATGKRSLLDIALKVADLLDRTFGPGKQAIWPGHQITEMGLVQLYRVTGEARYLRLAKFLLDQRGPDGKKGSGNPYNQSHARVVEQSEAVGHAVRATYMYSGMADVAALTGDAAYVRAMDRIWDDVVGRKLYITGGIGARASGEAFGDAFELPNGSAYNETCAAIGNDYWNQRLFLLHADARYIDVLERTLYNGLISGVSLDGKAFFYPNPLESAGQHARSPWFGCACCPGNITRFLASVPGYVYARRDDAIFVNLFVGSTAEVALAKGKVTLEQTTRYPWDGEVKITVTPETAGQFAMHVRVPGWARGEVAPGGLYRFVDQNDELVTLTVNGESVPTTLENGYVAIRRTWKPGDVIALHLPMPVRRIAADERVEADRGRVALQRGPIVYCAEWPDNPDGHVRNLVLPPDAALTAAFRKDLLDGVTVLTGKAVALSRDENDKLVQREQAFTAIPYYAWANRGKGEMVVWIASDPNAARPLPFPTVASRSRVRTSGGDNPAAIHDGETPRSSGDPSSGFFHWWPRKGTTEWVEYDFAEPAEVASASVYWFDDTGRGECRVPQSWRLLFRADDGSWKPVKTGDTYGVAADTFNTVRFTLVRTNGLRLETTLQSGWSAGIQEWGVPAAHPSPKQPKPDIGKENSR